MKIVSILIFWFLSLSTMAKSQPVALVWNGPGACFPYCVSGVVKTAKKAGFKVIKVDMKTKNFAALLEKADLWIQPGGKSKVAVRALGPKRMSLIRKFIFNGGGYVGLCAGMLLATKKIGQSDIDGLGILGGETVHLMSDKQDRPYILEIDTSEFGMRSIYFSGGPYLKNLDNQTLATSYYSSGKVASVESHYGRGKVVVAGFHPEVPTWFKNLRLMQDNDGLDYDIAISMLKKAITH